MWNPILQNLPNGKRPKHKELSTSCFKARWSVDTRKLFLRYSLGS